MQGCCTALPAYGNVAIGREAQLRARVFMLQSAMWQGLSQLDALLSSMMKWNDATCHRHAVFIMFSCQPMVMKHEPTGPSMPYGPKDSCSHDWILSSLEALCWIHALGLYQEAMPGQSGLTWSDLPFMQSGAWLLCLTLILQGHLMLPIWGCCS